MKRYLIGINLKKGNNFMLTFLLIFLPVICFILWIYYKDKYNKENIHVLLKYFILGIIISFFAIVIEKLLIGENIFRGETKLIYTAFIVAGCTEEILKGVVLTFFANREKSYDEKLDGIIYSIFLSLGFATIENIIYVNYEKILSVFEIAFVRACISIPAHIMFAITMGYYLSKYKFEKNKVERRQNLFLTFLIPILLHGIFDFILMIEYRWTIIVFILYIIILAKVNLNKLNKYMLYSKKRFFDRLKHRK